jgi:hypothetical protein
MTLPGRGRGDRVCEVQVPLSRGVECLWSLLGESDRWSLGGAELGPLVSLRFCEPGLENLLPGLLQSDSCGLKS